MVYQFVCQSSESKATRQIIYDTVQRQSRQSGHFAFISLYAACFDADLNEMIDLASTGNKEIQIGFLYRHYTFQHTGNAV